MIAALAFGSAHLCDDGRRLRRPTFEVRSTLPLSAACLVANGVREQLSRLLATELEVELLEPAVPSAEQRRVLVAEATVFRVRGRLCDGFVIVRAADARRLVALAFGETERCERDSLSGIESATLERIVAGLVPLCNTLCGTLGPVMREGSERAACDFSTYFEVRTSGPVRLALGFALTRDPAEPVTERLTLAELAEVELAGAVELGSGTLAVPAFSRLAPGVLVPLETGLAASGVLRFGEVAFARGFCGVRNGRSVIAFDASAAGTRA